MDKHQLSERDICTKFITPAIVQAGWQQHQFREEVGLTDGRVMVRGKLASRIKNPDAKGGPKRADFVLYARPNVPIAVVEAKQAKFSVGHGMQQALAYWWLAFDYMNFRACGNVGNRKKGGWFPLKDGSLCSTYSAPCEESETRYLLDPVDDDDVALIAFDEEGKVIPAAKAKLTEVRARVREMTNPTAELSAVARWCLLVRNDPQLSKLVG